MTNLHFKVFLNSYQPVFLIAKFIHKNKIIHIYNSEITRNVAQQNDVTSRSREKKLKILLLYHRRTEKKRKKRKEEKKIANRLLIFHENLCKNSQYKFK